MAKGITPDDIISHLHAELGQEIEEAVTETNRQLLKYYNPVTQRGVTIWMPEKRERWTDGFYSRLVSGIIKAYADEWDVVLVGAEDQSYRFSNKNEDSATVESYTDIAESEECAVTEYDEAAEIRGTAGIGTAEYGRLFLGGA